MESAGASLSLLPTHRGSRRETRPGPERLPANLPAARRHPGPGRSASFLLFRKRAVVLLDERTEFRRHFVGAVDQRAVGFVTDFAPQAVLEALQPLGDKGLQTLELSRVLIDPI